MGAVKRTLPILQVAVCFFVMIGIAYGQEPRAQSATSRDGDLVGRLTKELNITPEQAKGGAGAIFGLVKSKLSPEDFSKVADAVPGMDDLLKAAPARRGEGRLDSPGSGRSGGLASLAGSFKSLGLNPSMSGKFASVLGKYVGDRGGSRAASLVSDALK